MKKKLYIYTLAGFVFVSVLGSLAHFFYEWSGYNTAVGLFTAVNESTWEHLKLLYFPYLIWTVFEYIMLDKKEGILPSKCIGVNAGMLSIVIFFYTYTGILGKSIDFLNILSFFIGNAAAFASDYFLIKRKKLGSVIYDTIAVAVFIGIGAVFVLFTAAPPQIALFKDPINFTYGI